MVNKQSPPGWVDRMLELLIRDRFHDEVIGDLHEWYHQDQRSTHDFFKSFGYSLQGIREIKTYQLRGFSQILLKIMDVTMLHNNIKIGIRSLFKHKLISGINVIGLTSALCCALFIIAYLHHEISFDRYHENANDTYFLHTHYLKESSASHATQTPLGNLLRNEFGSEVLVARYGNDPVYVELGERQFYEEEFYWGDAELFEVFDLPFKYGDPSSALQKPNTVVITETVSNKYFGPGTDPVGQILPIKVYDGDREFSMRIDGVMEDLPSNTMLPFQLIGSISNAFDMYQQFNESWGFSWLRTFVVTDEATAKRIEEQMPGLLEQNSKALAEDRTYIFQPLTEVHLYSAGGLNEQGNRFKNILMFGVIGAFIVLIAMINNINLTTAITNRRSLEVGIRKVSGANQRQIFWQFITESVLLYVISGLLAMIVIALVWEPLASLTGSSFSMMYIFSWETLSVYGIIFIVTVLIAGVYPSIGMASQQSIIALAGRSKGKRTSRLRRALVVIQFSISVFLIISTTVIFQQLYFMKDRDPGFDPENLIAIKTEDKMMQERIEVVREEFRSVSGVSKIAISGEALPSEMNNGWGFYWDAPSREQRLGINIVTVDHEYLETIGARIVDGENFTKPYPADSGRSVVINEAAVIKMGIPDVIGMKVNIGGRDREIIGVVRDFHYRSMKEEVEAVAYFVGRPGFRSSADNFLIRIDPDKKAETLTALQGIWDQFTSAEQFDFRYVSDMYALQYEKEERFFQLFTIFSMLSILISCIGLFGMIVFVINERTKEISIRKVLGSSVGRLIRLIGTEFTLLVLLGSVIAIPVATLLLREWLQQFPYRVDISVAVIIGSALTAVIIAWLTIGFNTIKAALSNPVRYLRNE